MARFDVHRMPGGAGYLLDVQADLLQAIETRVVVPLLPADRAPPPMQRLNPVLTVEGEAVVMITQNLAAVPRRELGDVLTNLSEQADAIRDALDMLFIGF